MKTQPHIVDGIISVANRILRIEGVYAYKKYLEKQYIPSNEGIWKQDIINAIQCAYTCPDCKTEDKPKCIEVLPFLQKLGIDIDEINYDKNKTRLI